MVQITFWWSNRVYYHNLIILNMAVAISHGSDHNKIPQTSLSKKKPADPNKQILNHVFNKIYRE